MEGSEAERKAPKGLADQAESDRKRPSAQALAERDSPEANPFESIRFPPVSGIIAMFHFIGLYQFSFFFPGGLFS